MKCPSCKESIIGELKRCIKCGRSLADTGGSAVIVDVVRVPPAKVNAPKSYLKNIKYTKLSMTLTAFVVFVVIVGGYAYAIKSKKGESERATRVEYRTKAKEISASCVVIAYQSEIVIGGISDAWKSAIFSSGKKKDFNLAIAEFMKTKEANITVINDIIKENAESIKSASVPPEFENEFSRIKEIYLLVCRYAELAVAPSGSLQTYNSSSSQLHSDIKSAIREFDLINNK